MANEKRLIEAYTLAEEIESLNITVAGKLARWNDAKHSVLRIIDEQPDVDAVEVEEMREFAQDVAYQFGYYCQNGGRLHITHGGLSTLEQTFDILGWDDPHPVPECECEIDGCHEHATCGTPTKDGYKRVCGKHFTELQKEA